MIGNIIFATFSGISAGMAYFLVAAGLSWVFGLLRLLNMAHGAFFMVGAYVAFSVLGGQLNSFGEFIGASVAAALVVGALGFLTEVTLLRRLRGVDPHYVLIATFALMLLCDGAVKLIWGLDYESVTPPPVLADPIQVFGTYISTYTLFIILAGALIYVLLELVLHRTWIGKLMQAIAVDPWMAGVLGINITSVLRWSVVASFVLAGFAGGLLLPNQGLSTQLGSSYLLYAFFAVVIGGMGHIRGVFIAAIMLGLVDNYNAVLIPHYPGLAIYVALAIFLVVRPNGILSRAGH